MWARYKYTRPQPFLGAAIVASVRLALACGHCFPGSGLGSSAGWFHRRLLGWRLSCGRCFRADHLLIRLSCRSLPFTEPTGRLSVRGAIYAWLGRLRCHPAAFCHWSDADLGRWRTLYIPFVADNLPTRAGIAACVGSGSEHARGSGRGVRGTCSRTLGCCEDTTEVWYQKGRSLLPSPKAAASKANSLEKTRSNRGSSLDYRLRLSRRSKL